MNQNKKYICLILIFILTMFSIKKLFDYNTEQQYQALLTNINNKEWSLAKEKIETLKNYKDCSTLSKKVNFNYYIELGDYEYKNQEYSNALYFYNLAQHYNSDNSLKTKINSCSYKISEIKKIEQYKKRKELIELEKIVHNAFCKIDLQDFGNNKYDGRYLFYTYPEAWNNFTYNEKKYIIIATIKYVELKKNISHEKAQICTRILNIYDNSLLGSITSIY